MAGNGVPGGKGYELEEILRLYFLESGLFAVRSVPIVVSGEEITDLDIWLYERPSGSMRRRLLVDAKSKVRPRAAERFLWAKGAQQGLGLDGAYVATTDKRPVVREIAKQFDILLLDGIDLERISSSGRINLQDRLTEDELLSSIRKVDVARYSRSWMEALRLAKSSLVDGLGGAGANRVLEQFNIFARGAVSAHPGSDQAHTAIRGALLCAALCAINLDFVAASVAFRPIEERHRAFVNAIRYGSQQKGEGLGRVRMATALVRQFLINGKALANQLEQAFEEQANAIPAEIIADSITRMRKADQLFLSARELEAATYSLKSPGFDQLSADAKSLLGALLDFVDCPRDKFANATQPPPPRIPDGVFRANDTAEQGNADVPTQQSGSATEAIETPPEPLTADSAPKLPLT